MSSTEGRPRRLRARSIVVLCVVLLAAGAVRGCWVWLTGGAGCDVLTTYPPATSPTGEFIVGVRDDVCSDGGFVTVLPTTVEIWRRGEEGTRFPLVVVEYGSQRPVGPHFVWTGPGALSIRLAIPYGARLKPPPFRDLVIDVLVEPPAVDRTAP